ncbi:hypothetical protein BST81_20630 [Leptolyngbya sp. 'hensonii']|nr:hypothetical protein BST81_20630 [Leptolyngbya sp. 'hensonii']
MDNLRKELIPRQAFSWQTLLALCLFSYLMALPASPLVREFLSFCGWIFLVLAVGWETTEHPVKIPNWKLNLGPWITGALISVFLFRRLLADSWNLALVCWPIISVTIASLSKFLTSDFKTYKVPPPKDRQFLVILILSNLILSCWLQFYFVLESWTQEYPSLTSESFGRSAFVIKLGLFRSRPSQGNIILTQAKEVITTEVNRLSWPEVERWLLNLKDAPEAFGDRVMARVQAENQARKSLPIREKNLWSIEPRILPGKVSGNAYELQVLAIWQGPSLDNRGYYLQLSCQLQERSPIQRRLFPSPLPTPPEQEDELATPDTGNGNSWVNCGAISDRIPGRPKPLPPV